MSGRDGASLLAGANLLELSPDHVDEGERIGFLHEDKAAALGRLMAVDGQRDPIKVVANKGNPDKPWRLVTGMHRLIGARIECLTVFAIEVSGKPEDLADLEASENLHRRPLAPIERAKFTAALVQAAQERLARERGGLKQQQLAIRARWERVKGGETRVEAALTEETEYAVQRLHSVYNWEESVGEALGMSRRSIHNDLQLYRLIIEPFQQLAERLSNHPVIGENASALREIAQVKDEGLRRQVIEALLDDEHLDLDMAKAAAGIERPSGAAPAGDLKFVNQVVGGLSRLSATAQKHHLDVIVRSLKSVEVKRQLFERLKTELGEADADEPLAFPAKAQPAEPAVSIRQSVKVDHIACLFCGGKFADLEPHIEAEHGFTADNYRARWKLFADYPMVAPDEQERRRIAGKKAAQ